MTHLRKAGIYTHIHIDGYCHSLLKYLKDFAFDGYEALTPRPQGDVSLEQIKDHIGNQVLLDGIPAVMFLPTFSREELMQTTEKIVDSFTRDWFWEYPTRCPKVQMRKPSNECE